MLSGQVLLPTAWLTCYTKPPTQPPPRTSAGVIAPKLREIEHLGGVWWVVVVVVGGLIQLHKGQLGFAKRQLEKMFLYKTEYMQSRINSTFVSHLS